MKKLLSIIISVLLLIPSMPAFAEDAKIIYSTSFENGIESWEYIGKFSAEYTSFAKECHTDGEKSLYINDISDQQSIGLISPKFEVIPGEAYSASADFYLVSGKLKLYFKFYDGNGSQISSVSITDSFEGWTNIVKTQVAPGSAKYAAIYLTSDSSTYGEGYFDNFIFAKGVLEKKIPQNGYITIKESVKVEADEKPIEIFSESFEADLSGWTLFGKKTEGAVVLTDEDAFDGSKSVKITDNDDKSTEGISSSLIEIEPEATYTAVAYIKRMSGDSIRLYFKYYDQDKKLLENASNSPKFNIWEPITKTGKAPENAKYCQIQLVGVSALLGEAYVDKISLYKGRYVPQEVREDYIPPKQLPANQAYIVQPVNGRLVYNPYNELGETLSDFSYAGFHGGDYELPESSALNIVETLSPSGQKDDTDMLQAAIDRAERKDGGINIVKLKAGKYYIGSKGVNMKSGVLLSGEGQGPSGTIIYAYEPKQYIPLNFNGSSPVELASSAKIEDDYIKAGSKTFKVDSRRADFFKPGDRIKIFHESTMEWATAIKMIGTINVYDDITSWLPGTIQMNAERIITAINGNEITVDIPMFVPYIKSLVPSYIAKISDPGRIENAGIENLRVESYFNGSKTDEVHATSAISIKNAKNVFLRDITCKYFYYALVTCGSGAYQVTVRNCSYLEPVSRIEGMRRYSFAMGKGSQQVLVSGCYSYSGRHDYATNSSALGPIVFSDSVAEMGNTSSESHGQWTTGVLYDNIYHIGNNSKGFTAISNRGIYGTALSQGWTAAGSVIWNGLASTLAVHKPPLSYQNFAVGIWGLYTDPLSQERKAKHIASLKGMYRTGESTAHTEENFATDINTSIVGDSYKESVYNPVEPRSLFKAQLAERYTGNYANVKPNSPIITNPFPDSTYENSIEIKGIYQLGAEKVTVYIDNIPYNASLNKEDNTFSLSHTLEDGAHKIYATQTIDGIEGNKTADRFVIINVDKGNFDYLQSIYDVNKNTMLINDPRVTYDKIGAGIKVIVNGKNLLTDVAPISMNGRVLVPLRAIFEALGAEVSWDEATRTALANKDGMWVKLTENQNIAYANGVETTLDVPATIINGRFVVPVRFISETLGCTVEWEEKTSKVIIRK